MRHMTFRKVETETLWSAQFIFQRNLTKPYLPTVICLLLALVTLYVHYVSITPTRNKSLLITYWKMISVQGESTKNIKRRKAEYKFDFI